MIRFGTVELPMPSSSSAGDGAVDMVLRGLSTAQKDALAAFFKDDARGMSETWIYTDAEGAERQMRFDEAALVFVQFGQNQWDVSVRLAAEEVFEHCPRCGELEK